MNFQRRCQQMFLVLTSIFVGIVGRTATADDADAQVFRAGAAAIDITPEVLPVLVNGGMTTRTADKVVDRLNARCLVLDDGTIQIAIVVVDSCMVPRDLLDEAKALAAKATKIPTDRMLISATHTHSAPAAMGCLGTDRDERYVKFLPARIARGIQLAQANLEPARIGWAKSRDPKNIYNRRWLMKEGTATTNPFSGKTNDRAQMNPGNTNPNKLEQTGTVDDEVSVLSVQAKDGRPIALLANYSTHYAGAPALSADYFGVFAEKIGTLIKADEAKPAFVGIMSNGTSGDANCVDFSRVDRRKFDYHSVAEDTARAAFEAYGKIEYSDWVPLAMEEALLTLDVRMPTAEEVAQAKEFLATEEGKQLRTIPAVYARETVVLSEMPPTRELKLQAIRIGDLGIAAIPNEVFTSTGLAIKKESPLAATFTIELANGAEGYIPPPEQHKLGGYTTWRARTSCLEEEAEPKIRARVMELLQTVAAVERVSRPARQRDETRASLVTRPTSPLSPEDSLKFLHVRPGMKVELVACEPLIRDPVAFDWGADGKLWVVEMLDYPTGIDGKGKPGGRVVFLEDKNADGRYDKSTLFLEGLNFPLGVMAWRKGMLITAAPDIIYAEDTNNDGKADRVEKLYTGFFEGNQQLRMNGLRWGLDNWIYGAGGISSGAEGKPGPIKSVKTGEVVDLGARDFRIKPDEGLIEPLSGWSQFGRNRDAYGNWFGCQNAKPMFHFVLEDRYLRRNPHVTYPDPKVLISDVPGQRPVFPRSTPGKFHHASQAGRFTSANSAMIYGDELLGKDFIGNSFVSEPVHNLVHREIVERDGVTFKSHKPQDEENTEFLASEDTWFRPNMIRTGPDGALWIADMYREIIEHPRWVSDELKPLVDTRSGTDRGRIYRVFPEGVKPRAIPRIDKLDTKELVALLESPNMTVRDMVQMRIVNEKNVKATEGLEQLVKHSARPESRLQALCLLDGLGRLTDEVLFHALSSDINKDVCRRAILLCVGRENTKLWDLMGGYHKRFLDPEFAFQTSLERASVMGQAPDSFGPQAGGLLGRMAYAYRDNPYVVAAIFSSLNKWNLDQANTHLLRECIRQGYHDVVASFIDTTVALRHKWAMQQIAFFCCRLGRDGVFDEYQIQTMAIVHEALSREMITLEELLPDTHRRASYLRGNRQIIEEARRSLSVDASSDSRRIACVKLLSATLDQRETDWELIIAQLSPRQSQAVHRAVVEELAKGKNARTPAILLANWNTLGPGIRSEILDTLMSRADWTQELLRSLTASQLIGADIDAARRQRLLKSGDAKIRERAARLFAQGTNPDRAELITQYEPVLTAFADGQIESGQAIFKQRCSACHKLDDVGNQVGPDLKGLTDKSPANMLTSILDPNRAVEPRYVSYTAITNQGKIYSGMLADEAGGSLTLLDGEGKRHAILRRDLDELTASGKSLMPEGLEKDIDQAAMRDLLAYLQQALK